MLAALVTCVATAAGRPAADAEAAVKTLGEHWLTSLDDYAALTPTQRRELKLPLFLRSQLDRIVSTAAAEGRTAAAGHSRALIRSSTGGAVRAWLERRVKAANADEVFSLFSAARLDDFFLLPMLDDTALRILGVAEKKLFESLMTEIDRLRKFSPHQMVGEWARVQGHEKEAVTLEAQLVDAWVLRASKGAELADALGLPLSHPLIETVPPLTHFSSVLESFVWLHSSGFGKYSFHFARYNIPFYALPYVNFFILEEMGVSHDDTELLAELQKLKSDPLFGAKALAYWLRDLELERYIGAFAAASILSLDHLMQLATSALPAPRTAAAQVSPPVLNELVGPLHRVVTTPNDRNKLLAGMQELNEFHWYYRATSLLLHRIGFGRFAQLFTQYGISIDVISLLEDAHLAHMGIRSLSDRTALLGAIARVRHHLPHGLDNITPVPEPTASSGVVPPDTRPLDELLSYINFAIDEQPKGGKKKGGAKAKPAAKGANKAKASPTKSAAQKHKGGDGKHATSAPSSPVIQAKKPQVEFLADLDEEEELPPPHRVAGGSGKRASAPALATAPPAASVPTPALLESASATSAAAKPALSHSDTDSKRNSITAEKVAALLRASGGALSPDPCEAEFDPEKQAEVDIEVEQFRRRLEAAANTFGRPRTKIFAL